MAESPFSQSPTAVPLCPSADLQEGQQAVPFEVLYYRQKVRAFAIRFEGQPYAFLNRCSHVPMELDYQENQFFDSSGQWLMCATHGATYSPVSGRCVGGPCRGGLVKIQLDEREGMVHWHTSAKLHPCESDNERSN